MPQVKLTEDELDSLQKIVKHEIDQAESYLDSEIRPIIRENYSYYNRELPKPTPLGLTYVDNSCKSYVKHFVSQAKDAFVNGDTIEIIPDTRTGYNFTKIATEIMNDILDRENNRTRLYNDMFTDSAVAKVGILKPFIDVITEIDSETFYKQTPELVSQLEDDLVMNGYEIIDVVVEDSSTEESRMLIGDSEIVSSVTLLSGYIKHSKDRKTIKIDTIPPVNFIIDSNARDVKQASIVGHKNNVTISELLTMGFDYDKVEEVADKGEREDLGIYVYGDDTNGYSTPIDKSLKEVTLYEVYLKTTMTESSDMESKYSQAQLYRVFYCNDIILDAEEVDIIPYACATIDPVPHRFWGTSLVDTIKASQSISTGLTRQILEYNALQLSPKILYHKVDERAMLNPTPGACIEAKDPSAFINPVQMGAISSETGALLEAMRQQREQVTGITLTGQGTMTDVLKAGGSAISASMVLSENQMMVKDSILNLLDSGIKPLCEILYCMIRDEIDEWITRDNQIFNPSEELPKSMEVKIRCPIGTDAKLVEANKYKEILAMINSPEYPELKDPVKSVKLAVKIGELQDIKDISDFLPTEEEMAQKDAINQQLMQMQTMLQQLQTQIQDLTNQNAQLNSVANDLAVREMSYREEELKIKREAMLAKSTKDADDSHIKEQTAIAKMEQMADDIAIRERKMDLEELQTSFEMKSKTNVFIN